MGFLDTVKSWFAAPVDDPGFLTIYVRAYRCKEPIKARLHIQHDASLQEDGTYLARKTLVGNNCFQRVEVTLIFDDKRRLIQRDIVHGEFLTLEEYQAALEDA